MEKISLYRKYRPKTLNTIVGQELIKKTLLNANKNNSISNAYIFSGPRGVGKTSIAKILAAAINCEDKQDGDCCLKCNNCLQIINNKAIDIVELDAASNNGVEQMRDIIESANYFPSNLKFKVYIIDEAHMLSNSAWNAMLKTIEEPPAHCVFIFATTEYNKIPLTIVSRCQRFDFNRLNRIELKQLLDNVIKEEGIEINDQAINKIVEISDGSGRDSLSILGQLTNYSEITTEVINDVFGLSSNETKILFINNVLNKNYVELKKQMDQMYNKGLDLENFLNENIELLIEILVFKDTNDISFVKKINERELKDLKQSKDDFLVLFNELVSLYQKIKKTKYKKTEIDIFIINLINKQNKETTHYKAPSVETQQIISENNNKKELEKEDKTFEKKEPQNNKPLEISEIKWSSDLKIIHHKKVVKEKQMVTKEEITNSDKTINKIDIDNHFKIINPIDFKNQLMQIAFWTKQSKIKEDRELLNKYLEENLGKNKKVGEILNIFQVSKLFASSENGIILSSEFNNQILKLNQINETKEFVEVVCHIFKRPVLVLGVSTKQEKEIKDHIKQNKEQLKKDIIKDIEINNILSVVDKIKENNKLTLEALSKLEIED